MSMMEKINTCENDETINSTNEKILDELHDIVFDFLSPYARYGAVNIDCNEIRGWVEATEFVSSGLGTGCFINSEHETWCNNSYDTMVEYYLDEFKDTLPVNITKDNYWDVMSESNKEQFSDYEHEWFEPTLIGITIFDDSSLEVWFNCSDTPYYRAQYNTTLVTINDITDLTVESIFEKIKESYKY